MCGIVGYKLSSPKYAVTAFKLFTRLMEESQVRGKHASGVTWRNADRLETYKAAVPAKELVLTSTWLQLAAAPPMEAIGHTRYSTSGDWHDNANNQPLADKGLAVVHNGLVSMASKPEFETAYKVKTRTANDTEIILRRVLAAKDDYVKAFEQLYKVDPPIFACGFLRADGRLTVVRDHLRPMWFFEVQALGMVGFASTRDIIERALAEFGCSAEKVWETEPYQLYQLAPRKVVKTAKLKNHAVPETKWKRPPIKNQMMARAKTPKMLKYDPPKHKQFDHRKNLRESFKQYCVAAITSEEIDPAYSLLVYLFERFELSTSQRLWICFLYGTFYHVGSVFLVLQEFPEFEKVDIERLTEWHKQNWKLLWYNTDRKWEKGHLVEMVESYIAVVGGQTPTAQEEFFKALLTTNGDKVVNFHAATAAIRTLSHFGRYSAYIYTEALARCVGLPLEADTVFLKESDSPRHGLAIALGRPELGKGPLTKEQWAWLEVESDKLLREVQKEYPKLGMDHWYFESCLCSWKGYHRPKKGRYLSYYLDRMIHEIEQTRATPVACGVDWEVLYQYRKETIIPEYLGELADPPRTGVYRPWEHVLKNTGRMIGLWPIVQRGLLK